MEPDDAAAPTLNAAARSRVLTLAGLAVVWTVAWSTPPGQIGGDTKNDLYVDAWGLMARALHLWDPQVSWGMLQNQGYGYLFPMGPFYAVLSSVLPVWVVQRLWWSAILGVGFLATLALLRALGLGRCGWVHLGALAYTLAPRVLSTLGAISPEAQTQLLAPLILLPLVRCSGGQLGARRAAAYSGLAILLCGGVNASATVLAAAPAVVWLVTRRRWWRARVTWWWLTAAAAAATWWLGPLLLLGRYSPPFLDWIENSAVVTASVGLLDTLKGTTHWLGHLVVAGGPWWPAGWAISSTPSALVATSVVGGLGLAGMAVPSAHRRFLWVTFALGLLLIAVPHDGPMTGPLTPIARDLLDGPLAPLRNVHKADPLLRLPLTIALVVLLRRLAEHPLGTARRIASARGVPVVALAAVLISAAPALAGTVTTRGTFTGMPAHWAQAGRWLSEHQGEGGAVLLPSASFGEYTWGRTIDEPLRSLTTAPYAVRDAVPLTPAGTIRFLDEIQRRAQTGRDVGGAGPALLSTGVKFVVLRNDLDSTLTGGAPNLVVRSAMIQSPGLRRVAAFGDPVADAGGNRIAPVEIFAITGAAAGPLTLWPSAAVPTVSGAPEALPVLRDSATAWGPVVFDGDADPAAATPRIETDTFRARTRYFGAIRGQDITATLTAGSVAGAVDYLPWPDPHLRTVAAYDGLRDLAASSSLANDYTLAGLRPPARPYAAVDGDPRTAWLTAGDPSPRLTLTFERPRDLLGLRLLTAADPALFGGARPASRVRVALDGRAVDSDLSDLRVPPGTGTRLDIEILDTDTTPPADAVTGLAEVHLPGLDVREVLELPRPRTTGATEAIVLSRDREEFDGCARTASGIQCLAGPLRAAEESGPLSREVTTTSAQRMRIGGVLRADPAHPSARLDLPDVTIEASSTRSAGLAGRPAALLDGDPDTAWSPAAGDRTPTVTIALEAPRRLARIEVRARGRWLAEQAPMPVQVIRDGQERFTTLRRNGRIDLPPQLARTLTVRLLPDTDATPASLELSEMRVEGLVPPAAPPTIGAPCGSGPELRVGGKSVPTSVVGERAALLGFADAIWQACRAVEIPAGTTRISLGSWAELDPATVIARAALDAVAGSVPATGQSVPVTSGPGGRLAAEITPATQERVLTLVQNVNPGWRATLSGRSLRPLTVDGFRQAFVVPAGAGGQVRVEFGPDRAYRWALLLGSLLAAMVVLAAALPDRRRERRSAAAPIPRPGLIVPVIVGATGVGVAGPAGGLLAGAVVGVSAVLARRRPARSAAVWWAVPALAVVSAGAVHAVEGTGTGPGPAGLESATRLLSLFAILWALNAARPHRSRGDVRPPTASPDVRSPRASPQPARSSPEPPAPAAPAARP